jgi:uncharacterized membrane protein (DUF106 family)
MRNRTTMLKKVIDRKIFSNNLLNNKLINNKITLLVVTALAFFSLYIHIINSHFSAVLLFFLTCALVYGFTKNMTLVLGAAFIVTMLATMLKSFFGFKEGLEVKEDAKKDDAKDTKDATKDAKDGDEETKALQAKDPEDEPDTKEQPPSKKAPFNNQKLNPALYNTPNKSSVEKQLGKASEMEQAYDNLEKIMGTEKINSISSETKDLIKQQNELIKQLKTMTPALNSAMSSLGSLDLNKLTGMFNSATKNMSELKDQ